MTEEQVIQFLSTPPYPPEKREELLQIWERYRKDDDIVFYDGVLASKEQLATYNSLEKVCHLFDPTSDVTFLRIVWANYYKPAKREPVLYPLNPVYTECLFIRDYQALFIAHTLQNKLQDVIQELDLLCAKHKKGPPEETLTLRKIIWDNLAVAQKKGDTESVRKNVETLMKINKDINEQKAKIIGDSNVFRVDFKGMVHRVEVKE